MYLGEAGRTDPAVIEFGKRVERWRKELGWPMHRLAEEAGISIAVVCALEAGKRDVRLSSALRLAAALGASLPELTGVCLTCAGRPPAGFACKSCGKG